MKDTMQMHKERLGMELNMSDLEKNGMLEERDYIIDVSVLLEDLWRGIKKFWWLPVILSILSAGVIYFGMKQDFSPYYTASATFIVNLDSGAVSGSIYDDNLKASQMSKTFPYIITSGVLKSVIAADLGVTTIPESITAENVEETNLFTLNVTSGDPNRAYDVLQSVIRNYPKIAETVVGSTNLNMLDETGVPTEPINQMVYRHNLMKGALPGAVLGIIIIVIYAITRRTIHKAEDITKICNLKHLGTLPEVTFKKRGRQFKKNVSVLNDKISPWYRESMYRIRTRVIKAAESGKMKSILVTSAIPGEGKSTVAFNLALTMAEGGKNVVLVDCDLHNPSIKNMIPREKEESIGSIGLLEVLKGEAELKDAIKYYEHLNIGVLNTSFPDINASEMVGIPKMWEIIAQLEEISDYVIIDTPPSSILPDASDLAKYADGVIYVVKRDYAKINQILDGLEHISESSGVSLIGSVLNSGKVSLGSYRY
ncbi:MAG: capsular exopolysaccharide family [Anaerocolumna sp.]|nr:capsular exopolysaccharide family [Anaerocolumna sp.]